jgi:hypothetical protein
MLVVPPRLRRGESQNGGPEALRIHTGELLERFSGDASLGAREMTLAIVEDDHSGRGDAQACVVSINVFQTIMRPASTFYAVDPARGCPPFTEAPSDDDKVLPRSAGVITGSWLRIPEPPPEWMRLTTPVCRHGSLPR